MYNDVVTSVFNRFKKTVSTSNGDIRKAQTRATKLRIEIVPQDVSVNQAAPRLLGADMRWNLNMNI